MENAKLVTYLIDAKIKKCTFEQLKKINAQIEKNKTK